MPISNPRQYFAPVWDRQERNSPRILKSHYWQLNTHACCRQLLAHSPRLAIGPDRTTWRWLSIAVILQEQRPPLCQRKNHIGTMQEPRCRAASKCLLAMICSRLKCGTTSEPCGNHPAVRPGNPFRYNVVPVKLRNHIGTMQEPRCRVASKVIFVV